MILITGANGQLGYDFKKLFDSLNIKYIATDYMDLDITKKSDVEEFIEKNILEKGETLTLLINCAAYNNVDKAEEEKELCYSLNAYAPRDLAVISKKYNALYITYSTDFVFDGEKKTPYTELDTPSPLSVYSQAKLEGERLVLSEYNKSFVVRTSWVFGVANNNFNKQVINWSSTRDLLSIVSDQVSSPTYSKDLAFYSWELIKTEQYGLYHLSNSGVASKYDQAKYILEKIGWKGELKKAKSSDFILPAKRAEYSKLDSTKLEKTINQKLPSWQSGIDRFLDEMKEYKSEKN